MGARRGLLILVALVFGGLLVHASAAASARVTLPDLKIFVPRDRISIGSADGGGRELRFTHITADVGAGPFEMDPSYNAKTGVSSFVQAIYRSPSAGTWVLDHKVPVAATGVWHPPSDYAFPLTAFTLNRITTSGAPGAVVARSPKTDYCITGDVRLDGIPNTPDQTYIPQSNCTDPTQPLGWSVGWGDEYDQTDAGQPIPLSGVANGTYILRAVVDPRHVFTESNTANDVTETTLRITGDSVTVIAQRTPGSIPPSVTLTSPHPGSRLSGTVTLRAIASAHAPAVVRSVQFLLDGQPLGAPRTTAPYRFVWNVAATPGKHRLSAQVLDSAGNLATAVPVPITVVRPPALKVLRVRWRRGVLTLRVTPSRDTVRVKLAYSHRHGRSMIMHHGRLHAHTARPRTITLSVLVSGHVSEPALTLRFDEPPRVNIVNPVRGETVSGILPVAAQTSGGMPTASVRFLVDGRRLGRPLVKQPYALRWDTRKLSQGTHDLAAQAVDVAGRTAIARLKVKVENPAPPMTCFVQQVKVNARGEGQLSTPSFHTAAKGETLLALVSSDGPAQSQAQSVSVNGAGLRWRLVKRANHSFGDSEIWTATARQVLSSARVTSTPARPGYNQSLTVVAMEVTDGVGATAGSGGDSGTPQVNLRTLSHTSLIFAAGNDWDRAAARVLPPGWGLLDQWLNTETGDSFWSQTTTQPTGRAHTLVHVRSGGPTGDRWNLAAAELINDGG